LKASNTFGNNAKTRNNYITVSTAGSAPVSDFTGTPTSITIGQSVQFADQSSNTPTNWLWDFGDGTTSTIINPSHSYSSVGSYTVSLKATNTSGNNTKTRNNYIIVTHTGGQSSFVTDYEGNVYETVKIGDQWWMAENLKSTKYNDGTSIPHITGASVWVALTTPGYCWFNNDIANRDIYGALYNWYAVNTVKLAPAGWHVATDDEWKQLEMAVGMTQGQADATGWRGTYQGTVLKYTSGWNSNGNGTNTSGFSALPGGCRYHNGDFYYLGIFGYWWSATEYSTSYTWYRFLYCYNSWVFRNYYPKTLGFSVRCVKD
jgi:uncharacterized protein (TIGR02145 family)